MSIFWSVLYGVFLANVAFYLLDILVDAVKSDKRRRNMDILLSKLEDEEDEY